LLALLTGLIYPLLVTGLSDYFFADKASGSFLYKNRWVGSKLIGQKFSKEGYFWPRPSANEYDPLASGGSNLGPISLKLKEQVEERKTKWGPSAPVELLYATGSGLDPYITAPSAYFQAERVAKARNVDKEIVEGLIKQSTLLPRFGFIGRPIVNVLELNLLLDEHLQ
jgi:potassium-transporting ATPase KdpC subunit